MSSRGSLVSITHAFFMPSAARSAPSNSPLVETVIGELLQRAFRVSFQSVAIRVVQTVQYTKCAGVMRKSDGKV